MTSPGYTDIFGGISYLKGHTLMTDMTTPTPEIDEAPVHKGFTLTQLSEAFDRVANPDDWRDEIFAECSGEAVLLVTAAIEFYTATTPTVSLRVADMKYILYSVGYRMGPAGDH